MSSITPPEHPDPSEAAPPNAPSDADLLNRRAQELLDEFGRWEAGLERQPTASEMLSLIRKLVEASSPDDKLVQVLRAQARVYELLDPDEPMFRSIEMESVAYYPHT